MNRTMQDLRYRLERLSERLPGENKKRSLILAGLLAALLFIVPLYYAASFLGSGSAEPEAAASTGPNAQSHAMAAWRSVFSALTAEDPPSSVDEALRRAAAEGPPGLFENPVTRKPYLFNPSLDDWMKPERAARSVVLLYSPPGEDGTTQALLLGHGGMPQPVTDTPPWVARAVAAPGAR